MKVKKYTTDIFNNKYFFEEDIESLKDNGEENNIINIHPQISYQKWRGLGGALTNATICNFEKLDTDLKENLLNDYFKELNYEYIRLPIGSTDFSNSESEDYTKDFNNNVEIIKKIKERKDIKIIATPWSPPAKFKNNSSLYGGNLLKKYYEDYANYLAEFIHDYEFVNIKIDYLSVQNEPKANQFWESCVFELKDLKDFLYDYVIPKLKNTEIVLWEHNKDNLYNIFEELYEIKKEVRILGFHWYTGAFFEEMDLIRSKYPEILLFETEMCCGFSKYNKKKWIIDAEYYLSEIINGLHHGLNAFLDWNLLLDFKGGPNYKNNYCKSPIILNKKKNNYIKTPIYYYLKHIGAVGDSLIIATSNYARDNSIETVALEKNGKIHLIVLNKSNYKKKINIRIKNNIIKDNINKHSIVTYIFEG